MRLDVERQNELEPKRWEYAIAKLNELGITNIIEVSKHEITFSFNGNWIKFFPYTGWHTGKGIKDGRGITKLLNQLK